MWEFEQAAAHRGYSLIAGIDEAGRGPLAGPVVSAAVILPRDFICPDITDSKKLSPKKRDTLFPIIQEHALGFGVGIADHREIDAINILKASLLSMKRAVENLSPHKTRATSAVHDHKGSDHGLFPDYLLIDGKFTIDSPLPQEAVIKGDSKSISIAAASIIAKVTRDRIMEDLHCTYPCYGFDRHKGYPTKAHKLAIESFGPCPVHRKSFKGVSQP